MEQMPQKKPNPAAADLGLGAPRAVRKQFWCFEPLGMITCASGPRKLIPTGSQEYIKSVSGLRVHPGHQGARSNVGGVQARPQGRRPRGKAHGPRRCAVLTCGRTGSGTHGASLLPPPTQAVCAPKVSGFVCRGESPRRPWLLMHNNTTQLKLARLQLGRRHSGPAFNGARAGVTDRRDPLLPHHPRTWTGVQALESSQKGQSRQSGHISK